MRLDARSLFVSRVPFTLSGKARCSVRRKTRDCTRPGRVATFERLPLGLACRRGLLATGDGRRQLLARGGLARLRRQHTAGGANNNRRDWGMMLMVQLKWLVRSDRPPCARRAIFGRLRAQAGARPTWQPRHGSPDLALQAWSLRLGAKSWQLRCGRSDVAGQPWQSRRGA